MVNNLDKLFRLDGKVIVITGAVGLLGVRHAEAIAAYGGIPVLLDLSKERIDDLVIRLNAEYGVNASGYVVDISDEEQVHASVDKIIAHYGGIYGLVNNAANNPKVEDGSSKDFSRLENFPLEVWQEDVSVGLTGAFLCAKYFGYQISKNIDGGTIINISSDLGVIAPDQRIYKKDGLLPEDQPVKPVTYSVVKAGLIGLTRYLATYWAEKNVRCNAMCPGGVYNGQSDDFLKKVQFRVPMGRLAAENEYQGTLLWMLSDASSYLNGAIVSVDGGRSSW